MIRVTIDGKTFEESQWAELLNYLVKRFGFQVNLRMRMDDLGDDQPFAILEYQLHVGMWKSHNCLTAWGCLIEFLHGDPDFRDAGGKIDMGEQPHVVTVDEIMAALRAVEAKCKAQSEMHIRIPPPEDPRYPFSVATGRYDMGHDEGWVEAFAEAHSMVNEIVDAVEKGVKL